jgi:copper chaperone CopZ
MRSIGRYFVFAFFICAAAGCTAEVTLSVPDMMCEESCAVKVREVLAKQEGVQSVKVDFPSRTATLAVRGSSFSTEQAIAALVDHGFEEATLKTQDFPVKPVKQTPNMTAPRTISTVE